MRDFYEQPAYARQSGGQSDDMQTGEEKRRKSKYPKKKPTRAEIQQKQAARYAEMPLQQRYEAALNMAAQMLSFRALSEKMLREKMQQKGMEASAIDFAVAYLVEHNMLCDDVYAQSVVRSYTNRGYGVQRVKQELYRRGIDREQMEQALEEHTPDFAAMTKLLDKRLHGDVSDRKEVDKAVAALMRRGFVWSDIRQVLNAYGSQIDEEFA